MQVCTQHLRKKTKAENKLMIEPRSQSEVALMCVRFMSVVFMHLNAHNIDYYYYYYFQYALTLI